MSDDAIGQPSSVSQDERAILDAGDTEETPEEIKEPEQTDEEIETAPEDTETESETVEEVETKGEDELEETEEINQTAAQRFKEIVKDATPEFLKKHPELRANFFQAEQFKEIYPTVDDAKQAAQKAEVFDYFDAFVAQGDLSKIIDAVGERGQSPALTKVADTILPTLYQKDPQLYVRAAKPVIGLMFNSALKHAAESKDDNLKAAVSVLAKFVNWNGKGSDQPPAEDSEKTQLRQQLASTLSAAERNYESEVYTEVSADLSREIQTGLDPDKKMTSFVKEKLVETIINDINLRLSQDKVNVTQMNALWNKARLNNLDPGMKAQLKSAFLSRARQILPAIRSKRRAEALGMSPKAGNNKTNIPGSPGVSKVSSKVITPKEAREKKLTPMEIIKGGRD